MIVRGDEATGEVIREFGEAAKIVWEIVTDTAIIKDTYYPPAGITGRSFI